MNSVLACVAAALIVISGASTATAQAVPRLLPVGDGRVSRSPEIGHVFACQTTFRTGRPHSGPWIQGAYWAPLEKPRVEGRILWPEAETTITHGDDHIHVESNGLPVDQPTGRFPIEPSDSVYEYDPNPNAIQAQNLEFQIPGAPVRSASPGCLPMGMIGFTLTGVALYNALDDAGLDAAAHEIQDLCDGHPQGRGQYHYHSSSACLPGATANEHVGWALDGYPIFGMRDERGRLLGNADLDPCHGRAEDLTIAGRTYDYAYRLTPEYPYTMGCFSGALDPGTRQDIRNGMGERRARPQARNRNSPPR